MTIIAMKKHCCFCVLSPDAEFVAMTGDMQQRYLNLANWLLDKTEDEVCVGLLPDGNKTVLKRLCSNLCGICFSPASAGCRLYSALKSTFIRERKLWTQVQKYPETFVSL